MKIKVLLNQELIEEATSEDLTSSVATYDAGYFNVEDGTLCIWKDSDEEHTLVACFAAEVWLMCTEEKS